MCVCNHAPFGLKHFDSVRWCAFMFVGGMDGKPSRLNFWHGGHPRVLKEWYEKIAAEHGAGKEDNVTPNQNSEEKKETSGPSEEIKETILSENPPAEIQEEKANCQKKRNIDNAPATSSTLKRSKEEEAGEAELPPGALLPGRHLALNVIPVEQQQPRRKRPPQPLQPGPVGR